MGDIKRSVPTRKSLQQEFSSLPEFPYRETAEKLLAWFRPEARPMPWRELKSDGTPHSAYSIWISESMLQQTQVATVIPYWKRWMERWPDAAALAQATEQEVMKMWEGLGYYNRARNLLKAAQEIMKRFNGEFPSEHSELLSLPGIGPYTAGAICSIAFNQPRPIVDGNVVRVLCRLLTITFEQIPSELKPRDLLWRISTELVCRAAECDHPRACSYFNQAMMDLGATVCTPLNPSCLLCPLNAICKACAEGSQALYPCKKNLPQTVRREDIAVFVKDEQGRVLMERRSADSRNQGFWQMPLAEECDHEKAVVYFRKKHIRLEEKQLTQLKHAITKFQITVKLYPGKTDAKFKEKKDLCFVTAEELKQLPVTASHCKLLRFLQKKGL